LLPQPAAPHLEQSVDDAKQQAIAHGRAGWSLRNAKSALQEELVRLLAKALVREVLQDGLHYHRRGSWDEVHDLCATVDKREPKIGGSAPANVATPW
jgi:hypothetical protein